MAQTDKLRKYKSLFSTTLSSGIGTGTGDTITPASVVGLPTDTEITLTFDRVDSDGVATPSKLERITGTISGGNFTAYTRGVDGTTEQAHSTNCVIEMIWNADDWNDMVDWALVGHKQDGTHNASFIVASYISASAVTANTLSASSVIAGNLSASAVVSGNLAASSIVAGNLSASSVVAGNLAASSVSQGNLNFSLATSPAVVDSDVAAADTISSATYANISGADVSVTTSVTSNIFIISTVNAYSTNIAEAYYRIYDGSALVGAEQRLTHLAGNYRRTCTILAVDANKAAGTYTYTTQHKSDGSNTITAENCSMVAIALPV